MEGYWGRAPEAMEIMDHAYIAEHGLVDLYRRGLLHPEEEARFEEHFFGCAECTEEIEIAGSFARGMKAMAAEDAHAAHAANAANAANTAAHGAVVLGLFAWLARRGRFAQAGLALAALFLVATAAAVPALWLRVRAERTAGLVAAYRQQLTHERQRTTDLGHRLAASETKRAGERRQLEARLEAAEKAARAGEVAPWNEVLFNTPVFLLRTFRDEPGSPAAVIDLARTAGPVSLAVDIGAGAGDEPGFSSYKVRLTGDGGRAVLEKGGLHSNALDALLITFPAGFFSRGDYRLNVFGVTKDGRESALGSHPFRVLAGARAP